jgi:hypothetical protein
MARPAHGETRGGLEPVEAPDGAEEDRAMDRVAMIDAARAAAANVYTQWTGIDIDWHDVRGMLDAHLGDEQSDLTECWSSDDEDEFRDLVARELERIRKARV